MKKTTRIWLIILTIALPFSAQAKDVVYEWVDENGVTHLSSHPPAGQKAKKVNVFAGKSKANSVKPAPKATLAKQEPKEVTAPVVTKPAPVRKDPELCKQARKNLWNLKNRAHIYVQDNDTGERVLMPDDERQIRLEETEKQIEELCE